MALAIAVAFSSALHTPRSAAMGMGEGAGAGAVADGIPDSMLVGSSAPGSVADEPRKDPALRGNVAVNVRSATINAANLL